MRNDAIVHEGFYDARQLMVAAKDHTKHVETAGRYSAKETGVGLS